MDFLWYALAAFAAALILTDCFGLLKNKKAPEQYAEPYVAPAERKTITETSQTSTQQPQKSQFELDRETFKKANEVWSRCGDRNKSDSSRETVCSFGSYCVNEFLRGKCTNPEMQSIFSGISDKKAQDLFPYNEEQFDKDIKQNNWPPKYEGKKKQTANAKKTGN